MVNKNLFVHNITAALQIITNHVKKLCFMAIISTYQVKNWRILIKRSFTACIY